MLKVRSGCLEQEVDAQSNAGGDADAEGLGAQPKQQYYQDD